MWNTRKKSCVINVISLKSASAMDFIGQKKRYLEQIGQPTFSTPIAATVWTILTITSFLT